MQPDGRLSATVPSPAIESIIVPTDGTALSELGATFADFFTSRFGGNVRRFNVTTDDVAGAIVHEYWGDDNSIVCMATHEHRHSELLIPSVAQVIGHAVITVRRIKSPTSTSSSSTPLWATAT